jgi:hypothetical protein
MGRLGPSVIQPINPHGANDKDAGEAVGSDKSNYSRELEITSDLMLWVTKRTSRCPQVGRRLNPTVEACPE